MLQETETLQGSPETGEPFASEQWSRHCMATLRNMVDRNIELELEFLRGMLPLNCPRLEMGGGIDGSKPKLTTKQIEFLRWFCAGKKRQEIMRLMNLTVSGYNKVFYRTKLQFKTNTPLGMLRGAIIHGFISKDSWHA